MSDKKNIVIRNHNGESWDILYPETSAEQVIINDDDNIENVINNKIDKVVGKQLSTEDFTTSLKDKLENVNNTIKVSNDEPTNKDVLWFELK